MKSWLSGMQTIIDSVRSHSSVQDELKNPLRKQGRWVHHSRIEASHDVSMGGARSEEQTKGSCKCKQGTDRYACVDQTPHPRYGRRGEGRVGIGTKCPFFAVWSGFQAYRPLRRNPLLQYISIPEGLRELNVPSLTASPRLLFPLLPHRAPIEIEIKIKIKT